MDDLFREKGSRASDQTGGTAGGGFGFIFEGTYREAFKLRRWLKEPAIGNPFVRCYQIELVFSGPPRTRSTPLVRESLGSPRESRKDLPGNLEFSMQ